MGRAEQASAQRESDDDRAGGEADRGSAAAVVNAGEAIGALGVTTTSLREPWQPVCEVAEGGAAHDSDQAEGRNRDSGACIEPIQEERQSGDDCGRDGE